MKRNLIIILSVFCCSLLFSLDVQAQSVIPGTNEEKQIAVDRYNQIHQTSLTVNDLREYLAPTQTNLDAWKAVLAGFSQTERMNGTAFVGFAHDKTVTSNAHYRYISRYVVIIKKGM